MCIVSDKDLSLFGWSLVCQIIHNDIIFLVSPACESPHGTFRHTQKVHVSMRRNHFGSFRKQTLLAKPQPGGPGTSCEGVRNLRVDGSNPQPVVCLQKLTT